MAVPRKTIAREIGWRVNSSQIPPPTSRANPKPFAKGRFSSALRRPLEYGGFADLRARWTHGNRPREGPTFFGSCALVMGRGRDIGVIVPSHAHLVTILFDQTFGDGCHVFWGNSEVFHKDPRRCRGPEASHPDEGTLGADIALPTQADAGFDGDSGGDLGR